MAAELMIYCIPIRWPAHTTITSQLSSISTLEPFQKPHKTEITSCHINYHVEKIRHYPCCGRHSPTVILQRQPCTNNPKIFHHQIHHHSTSPPHQTTAQYHLQNTWRKTKMPPIEARPHPSKHRALHATQSFKPSQIIHTFHPLILHPSLSQLASVCTHCLRPGSPRACSRCHAAYYCNTGCQQAAWTAVHSKECKALQQRKLGSRTGADLPTPVRALLQILLNKEIEDGIAALDGHTEERRKTKSWPDLEMMAMAACAFAGRQGESNIRRAVELLCKVHTAYVLPRLSTVVFFFFIERT